LVGLFNIEGFIIFLVCSVIMTLLFLLERECWCVAMPLDGSPSSASSVAASFPSV
jgi:hypothetical protein